MDDSVFSSQFQEMRNAFAREGITIEVAYTPSGRADYMYEADRLLARAKASRISWNCELNIESSIWVSPPRMSAPAAVPRAGRGCRSYGGGSARPDTSSRR